MFTMKKEAHKEFQSVLEPEINPETNRPMLASPEKKISQMAMKMNETIGANETNEGFMGKTIEHQGGTMNGEDPEESVEVHYQKSKNFYSVLDAKEDMRSLYNKNVLKKSICGKFKFYTEGEDSLILTAYLLSLHNNCFEILKRLVRDNKNI